jgi:hypothetical protein
VSRVNINIVHEGALDFVVLKKILSRINPYLDPIPYGGRGKQYIESKLPNFNIVASRNKAKYIALLDLDRESCVVRYLNKIVPKQKSDGLIIRIAVKEVESWLLADRNAIAKYLSLPVSKIPYRPDELSDPKNEIFTLARQSKIIKIREGIPPRTNSQKEGSAYTTIMSEFVRQHWRHSVAEKSSPSLNRALKSIREFCR